MNPDNHLTVGWLALGAASTFTGRGESFAIIGTRTLDHAAGSIFAITMTLRLRVKIIHVLREVSRLQCLSVVPNNSNRTAHMWAR